MFFKLVANLYEFVYNTMHTFSHDLQMPHRYLGLMLGLRVNAHAYFILKQL